MKPEQIRRIGGKLSKFLGQFEGCFKNKRTYEHMQTYINGQVSDIDRKNAENIADEFGESPRNLQHLLGKLKWDEKKAGKKVNEFVQRNHSGDEVIGVVDESGYPKKGEHTAGAAEQYCGETGKVDNCVVGVHLQYCSGEFHTLVGSDLFLPEDWFVEEVDEEKKEEVKQKREKAGIPEDLEHRTKPEIALEEIRQANNNGTDFDYQTFDSLYGASPVFLNGLERIDQKYVGETKKNITGWIESPEVKQDVEPADGAKHPEKRFELQDDCRDAKSVETIINKNPVFVKQEWKPFKIKETKKGPTVWEVKHGSFYHKRGDERSKQLELIHAQNRRTNEEKCFLADVEEGTEMTTKLRVGFTRSNVEKNFEDGKQEVGMGDFEVRKYVSLLRHFILTMVSHLFLADQTDRVKNRNPWVTIPQMKDAAETFLGTLDLCPKDTKERIEERSRILQITQERNKKSYRSHRKNRIKELEELGYDLDQIPSCVRKKPFWIQQIE